MAQRSIREYHAKKMLARMLEEYSGGKVAYEGRVALVSPEQDLDAAAGEEPWLRELPLVVKPDQLFGKRGKNGLVYLGEEKKGASFEEASAWLAEHQNKEVTLLSGATGTLTHFLVEPFLPHDDEFYLAFTGDRAGDFIHFSLSGGVDVEANRDKMVTRHVAIDAALDDETVLELIGGAEAAQQEQLGAIVRALFTFYRECHFASLEFNPFAFQGVQFIGLDAVARVDDTAEFVCGPSWGELPYPPAFGRRSSPEERYIRSLDEKTGASLKLTLLNRQGKVWTMVAGGGASVIYADTVVDLGYGEELANYGEYSGNPNTEDTREYAKTLLELATSNQGEIFICGGGIANFTDVAKTFTGIIQALEEYAERIKEKGIKIYVRRGGPNYKAGLARMREAGERLGLQIEVNGPETPMTRIVTRSLNPGAEG